MKYLSPFLLGVVRGIHVVRVPLVVVIAAVTTGIGTGAAQGAPLLAVASVEMGAKDSPASVDAPIASCTGTPLYEENLAIINEFEAIRNASDANDVFRVKGALLSRITNECYLQSVLVDWSLAPSIRAKALAHVNEQEFLKRFFDQLRTQPDRDYNYSLKFSVLTKITDEAYLLDVALDRKVYPWVKRGALKWLENQTALKKIFDVIRHESDSGENYVLKQDVLSKITDEPYLLEVLDDTSIRPDIKVGAVNGIRSQEALKRKFEAIKRESEAHFNHNLKKALLERIINEEYLKGVLLDEQVRWDIRSHGVSRITDRSFLHQLIRNQKDALTKPGLGRADIVYIQMLIDAATDRLAQLDGSSQ